MSHILPKIQFRGGTIGTKFWEIYEPLPSIVLDISLEKENKKTKLTESRYGISLLEEEILRIKNRNNLEPMVYSRKKVLGRSKDHLII